MPRQSRIDAPGALHHIIVRGIARRSIFMDDHDRDRFLERFGVLLAELETPCFAWALMPNHVHLLLRTGSTPIAMLMRRLLTGYAVSFNRRHRRCGHLFQNRYKSILCQEETYLLELLRYIHLNPLRAGLVADLEALAAYRFCGHGTLLGKVKNHWQAVDEVLKHFGSHRRSAQARYRDYVAEGVAQGRRDDLVGGGLVRSAGGWSALKELRRNKAYLKGDERILGDSDFVDRVLAHAEERRTRRLELELAGMTLDAVAARVSQVLAVPPETVWSPGKSPQNVRARSLLCYWAVRELGLSMTALAHRLDLSVPAISYAVKRGEAIARERKLRLV